MEARNRTLKDWFSRVRTGQVKLPRFQRHEAWGPGEISALLSTVIRGLPAGATLVLEIGDVEPFHSRFLATAPEGTERVSEHLLDGQQRLTTLWRALHDNYEARTYFVKVAQDGSADEDDDPGVHSEARWERGGVRYPVWCDDPAQTWGRGFIPVRLLNPETGAEVRGWADAAAGGDIALSRDIETTIMTLRTSVAMFNVPYLSLPSSTRKGVALDVFMRMNTSSVRLSAFDIVVAQLEEATGQSLHDLVDDLRAAVPAAARYRDLGNLVLDVAALRENRSPTQASYHLLDLPRMHAEWGELIEGIRWAVELLDDERVFDGDRLPTVAVLPVLAALHRFVPSRLDAAGNARRIATAYLWRAFVTSRYEQASAGRSLQDLRGLQQGIEANLSLKQVHAPIFDEVLTPLPNEQTLLSARWPKTREILARGILAASLRTSALDIADGTPARADNLTKREYHHLFPDSLLTNTAGLPAARSFTALNCALVTWSTNRRISNQAPMRYLQERADGADLGQDTVRARLATHLVPYDELAGAGPYEESDGRRLTEDYEAFLAARARMLLPVILDLCNGVAPHVP